MAGKSFLSRLSARKGKYQVDKNANKSAEKSNHMDGKYRQTESNGDGPPSKKRKTDIEGGDNEFDDDWDAEMTQADFEDLDLQASQAYTVHTDPAKHSVAPSEPQPSTSTGHVTGRGPIGTFRKPELSRSSSSSGSSSNLGPRPSLGRSSSSHSGGSNPSNQSAYPSSLSSYGSTSSSSLKSGSSSEIPYGPGPGGSLSRGISNESLDMTNILGRGQSSHQPQAEEFHTQRQENIRLKLQLENLKEELCIREGENKLLRDNLKVKDTELDSLKMERLSEANQQVQQQTEREKALKNDVAKLETQLQFKNEEERELLVRCRDLETQIKNLRAGTAQPSPPRPQLSPRPSRSPIPSRSSPIPRSPKGGGLFPTKEAFLSTEASPSKQSKGSDEDRSGLLKVSKSATPRQRSGLKLKLSSKDRPSPGSQLVADLLEVAPSNSGGVMKLFNNRCTSTTVYNVQFDRDKHTSLLSPVKTRLSDIQTLMSQSERAEMISLVSQDHFNLALEGLTQLLRCDNSTQQPVADSADPGPSTSTSHSTPQQGLYPTGPAGTSCLDSAVLLLPLISDYLQHYVDMLDTSLETSVSTGNGTGSSSSPDSLESFESPTGSLGQLLNSTANFANDLESLVLLSLRTLHTLVVCDSVRQVIMAGGTAGSSENSAASSEDSTGSDVYDGVQRSVLPNSSRIPRKVIQKSRILSYLIRLANPGPKGKLCNTTIVRTCLQILQVLATHAQNEEVNSLMPLLTTECIQSCIECPEDDAVVLQGMILLKLLCHSNSMVAAFCTNTPACVFQSLQAVYNICNRDKNTAVEKQKNKLKIYLLVIQCLSTIATCHKGGLTILLESDCQCSVEVVGSTVTLLHHVMVMYHSVENQLVLTDEQAVMQSSLVPSRGENQSSMKHICIDILLEGLHLLHLMYQHDAAFIDRHSSVQHLYVKLICGLSNIFQHVDNNEMEMAALQELWDFNQDDSDLLQESGSEMDES